jgi:hypothetical protein
MTSTRVVAVVAAAVLLSACVHNPPRPVKSQFEDIPVAKGMNYLSGDSMSIETPTVQAAREVYRGRIELESLSTATRATLEANGWRHISTTKTAQHGISQVYEKGGTSLQVLLWEGLYYTYAEYTTARVLQAPK